VDGRDRARRRRFDVDVQRSVRLREAADVNGPTSFVVLLMAMTRSPWPADSAGGFAPALTV
jgi:hypothetical protein